LILDDRYIV
jgi:hypothetical protein